MKQDDMLNGFAAVGDEPVWETAKERRARLRPAAKTLAKENKWTMDQAWAFLDRGLGQEPTREAPPQYSTLADLNLVAQAMAERATKAIYADGSGLYSLDGQKNEPISTILPSGKITLADIDKAYNEAWDGGVAPPKNSPKSWVEQDQVDAFRYLFATRYNDAPYDGTSPISKPAPTPEPEPALSKNGRCIRLNQDAD